KDLELYFQHLEQTLTELNFLTPDNPRQTMTRLRRLFNRVRLDQMELSILRGMLTGIQNFIYHSQKRLAKLQAGTKPADDSIPD
ncbi:MAG TPA: tRNA (cytosine(32)/uridine(32)-2'-O)-methyltransferase TrmJ, partial [Cellvibrionaceae bacterium]|nr:tRNA (cytosine(32)/uridine(32)-2'-O)-methyltransferase TrmJ [Cellvibrionaceae bacterium]